MRRRTIRGPRARRLAIIGIVFAAFAAGVVTEYSAERSGAAPTSGKYEDLREVPSEAQNVLSELGSAAVRLPVAAVLGTLLALRPRRWAAPRSPVVIQTQIILAVVGALIMLVVGASLARAFGIVGVASLIRYRTKIDDPKDAVVMLSALGVGLACGVGLFFLAIFASLFLVAALWVIESYDPSLRVFELSVKLGPGTGELRSKIESLLRRYSSEFELRGMSADEASYLVRTPQEFNPAAATEALRALAEDDKSTIEWNENPKLK